MTIIAKTTSTDDLMVDEACEVEFYSEGKLLGTITVYNPESGASFIDYKDELNNIDYNLLELNDNGSVINDKPLQN